MNVAIVVTVFPVLSESFIIRMVESLHAEGASVCIYATDGFDIHLLSRVAPHLADLIAKGQIELVSPRIVPPSGKVSRLTKLIYALASAARSPIFFVKQLLSGINIRRVVQAATFKRLHGTRRHDVIHAQFLPAAVAVVASNFPWRADFERVVSYVRGFDITRADAVKPREIALLAGPRGLASLTCVSNSLARRAGKRGFAAKHIEVIHSGIPLAQLPFTPPSTKRREPIRFIQVGRLVEKKGYDLSLRMLERLGLTDFSFEIVGQGELESELRMLAEGLGLSERVRFSGPLTHSQAIARIGASNIMLLPSRTGRDGDSEGIPNVAKEAMALGVICVGSDHSGIPEIVRDGETGFIFGEGDVEGFARSVRKAIEVSSRWDEIARAARMLVERDFDVTNTSRKLLAHYVQINK